MLSLLRIAGLILLVFGLSTSVAAQPARQLAVPPDAEIKAAIDTLKDVFDKNYAQAGKTVEGKRVLARRLLAVAGQRKTPGMIFACYDQSRRLAASAGDVKTAVAAMEALRKTFAGLPSAMHSETLGLLSEGELNPEDAATLAALAHDAARAAVDRQEYAQAVTLARVATGAALKREDPREAAAARAFLAKIEPLAKAAETLRTKPDDPEANSILGAYWAFDRGNWKTGLKYLARGADGPLATAATRDLSAPTTAQERTALGETWHRLSTAARGDRRRAMAGRAWEWYWSAIAVATGDEDLKPSVRAGELEETFPTLFNQTLEGHTSAVAAVAVTPDGKTLLSASNDNSVRVWDAATGEPRATLDGHTSWVGSVVISPDGKRAYTAGGDNVIRIWDLTTLQPAGALEGHAVAIRGLALSADGKLLVSGGGDKTVRLWDLTNRREVRRYGPESNSVESVAISADGSRVFAGTDNGVVTVFDAKTGEVVSKFDQHGGTTVYTIAVTRDGSTAISSARDKVIRVWEVRTGKELRTLAGHTQHVYQVMLSADEKQLLSASFDTTVRLWDLATSKELKRFGGHTAGVQGACYGLEGRTIFSAAWDKTIRKWRVPSGLVGPIEKKEK